MYVLSFIWLTEVLATRLRGRHSVSEQGKYKFDHEKLNYGSSKSVSKSKTCLRHWKA
jgi:hypothetical protein